MKKIGWLLAKIKWKLTKNYEHLSNYYRKKGIKIGKKCLICSDILTNEPCLIEIGDGTTISDDVRLVTHDYSAHLIYPGKANLYGKITIGKNCFIGSKSLIMYGVTIGDNVIVAAGSVVTKSFKENNIIIGGNPARIISTWDDYQKKHLGKAMQPNELKDRIQNNEDCLVER